MKKLAMSPIYRMGKQNKIPVYYVVNQGENLQGIVRKFDLSINEIKKLNGLKNETVYNGQVLYLKKPKETFVRLKSTKNLKPEYSSSNSQNRKIEAPVIKDDTSNEWEEYQYRNTTMGFLGFTENIGIEDKELKKKIDHCLTAVTLILDHQAYSPDGVNTLPKIPRKNWTHFYTLYFNGDGSLVLGEKNLYIYTTQVQNTGSGAYANENKIISSIEKKTSKMISTHNDLFLENNIKFEDGTTFDMSIEENQVFKRVLESVSIFNRRAGMNYIYSLIKKEKDKIAKILGISNLIAIPFDIPKIATLQKAIGIIFYLVGLEQFIDSYTENDAEYRGPIMLSPVFFYDYEIRNFGNGNKKQILVSKDTYNSYDLWETYQNIGLTKK